MTLSSYQLEAARALTEDSQLLEHEVTALAENQGDIEAAVEAAVARVGICAMVVTPAATVTSVDEGVVAIQAALRIIVYETPQVNRHRANAWTALDAAERIFELISTWPGVTPESIRQRDISAQGMPEDGIAVDIAASVSLIHGATPAE